MKKEYATYYDYFIALYKVRLVWYSIFGTMALLFTRALLSFNVTVYLIMQVPLLTFLIWALRGFVRLIQLDFKSFCAFIGGEFVYSKLEADYQNPIKNLTEGFVGNTYFIKKNPQLKTNYQVSDFFIKHDDIGWAYYQTIQHHVFGIRVKKTNALQVFAYNGNFTLVLRKKDDFDFADFLEEKGVSFILGYSKERETQYEAAESKSEFINTVVQEEQAILQADSAGPIYNKPLQEVAVVNYKTIAEQFQAAREQLMKQFLGGKRTQTRANQTQTSDAEDAEQLTLDLDTASYQILDEELIPRASTGEQQLIDIPVAPGKKKQEATSVSEQSEQVTVDAASLQATEEIELTKTRKQKQTTNGGNI